MKVIFFKIDVRLNPHDKYEVISETYLPYSEENLEYAIEYSVDGQYHFGEIEEPKPEETANDVLNIMLGVDE